MSNILYDILSIKDKVGDRIRAARDRIGLKQADVALAGGIARATQVGYEAGSSEPTTSYLRSIQSTGIDIPYILFGHGSQDIQDELLDGRGFDWELLQTCHEDVEFFCVRFAPSCPSSYRWKMVAQLYQAIMLGSHEAKKHGSAQPLGSPLEEIQKIWSQYGKALD